MSPPVAWTGQRMRWSSKPCGTTRERTLHPVGCCWSLRIASTRSWTVITCWWCLMGSCWSRDHHRTWHVRQTDSSQPWETRWLNEILDCFIIIVLVHCVNGNDRGEMAMTEAISCFSCRGYEYDIQRCKEVKMSKFPFPVPSLKTVQICKRNWPIILYKNMICRTTTSISCLILDCKAFTLPCRFISCLGETWPPPVVTGTHLWRIWT